MFKCCRCTSSKGGSRSSADSDSNDTPTASRKMGEEKAEDDDGEMSSKEITVNGEVLQTEEEIEKETEETEKTEEAPTESAEPAMEVLVHPTEASAQPGIEAPAEPVIETPAEPAIEASTQPEVEASAQPVIEVSARPEIQAPTEPVIEAPAQFETETPAQPETEIPAESATESLVQPETEELSVQPAAEISVEVTVEAPVQLAEETPFQSSEEALAQLEAEVLAQLIAEAPLQFATEAQPETEVPIQSETEVPAQPMVEFLPPPMEEVPFEQQDEGNGDAEDKPDDLGLTKDMEDDMNIVDANIADTDEKRSDSSTTEDTVHEAEKHDDTVAEKLSLAMEDASSLSDTVVKEYDQIIEQVFPEDQIVAEESDGLAGNQMQGSVIAIEIPVCTTKTNLYYNSGYIERTIDNGPEDEGDDSVFEAPNEAAIKAQPVGLVSDWITQQHDLQHEKNDEYVQGGCSGMQEPPATPVARDELALRRHRFFSELLQVAQNTEHRVRFDPLGPRVHTGEIGDREDYLEQLVNRLEDVTRRLEKVPIPLSVQTQETSVQVPSPRSTPARSSVDSSEESPTKSPSDPVYSSERTVPQQPTSMSVAGYEDILAGPVREYLELSQKIGGDVATHSKLVQKAFQFQLQFIHTAASRAAPVSQSEHMALLQPMSAQIQQIQDFREKNRGSPFFNHLSAISESIPALGWVAVSPTPGPYVKEMNDAGQFYTNRVLKDWKEKNKIHIDWCKAWVQTLTDLQQYIRQHHTTGLVWAKTGAAPIGIPPPPPPSMPLGDIPSPLAVNDDRSALFAQINQGEDITKSLKKVTSDMQTHKNPSLRSGPAPFKAPTIAGMKGVIPANAPIDKPPVFTRDGKKWLVEYHKGENITIDNVEMNNVVYMFRCQDSTLTVKGKVNSVVMDSCRKSSVVFDSLVSSIEFVNCQSVQMQVLGKVPTISIDKTDGCQMYLSADSLEVELITSKSSEMNVMVPKVNGDYAEYPVPEQFKTTISHNGLNTMAVDSLG